MESFRLATCVVTTSHDSGAMPTEGNIWKMNLKVYEVEHVSPFRPALIQHECATCSKCAQFGYRTYKRQAHVKLISARSIDGMSDDVSDRFCTGGKKAEVTILALMVYRLSRVCGV